MLALMQIISVLVAGNCVRVGMSLFNLFFFFFYLPDWAPVYVHSLYIYMREEEREDNQHPLANLFCTKLIKHTLKAKHNSIHKISKSTQDIKSQWERTSCFLQFHKLFHTQQNSVSTMFQHHVQNSITVDITNESVLHCRNHCLASSLQSENTIKTSFNFNFLSLKVNRLQIMICFKITNHTNLWS